MQNSPLPKFLAAMKQKYPNDRYAALNGRLDNIEGAVRTAETVLPDGRVLGDLSREDRAQLLLEIAEARKFIAAAEGPKRTAPQPPAGRHFARPSDRWRR
jgi:hypothetical protein